MFLFVILTIVLTIAVGTVSITPSMARVTPEPAATCLDAGAAAARRHGVPRALMAAIAHVETGRPDPWPWAMNARGRGSWFASRDEALRAAAARLKRGDRAFDIGCFQLNHRWHGDAFATLESMIDPQRNADYAAQFLAALFDETGSWVTAAGFYHSRTPQHATRYRNRLARHVDLAALGTARQAGDAGGDANDQRDAPSTPAKGPRFARVTSAGGLAITLGQRRVTPLIAPEQSQEGDIQTGVPGAGGRLTWLRPAQGHLLQGRDGQARRPRLLAPLSGGRGG
ncbi:MAG: hypothetical protein AAF675_02270 [Pseudomonadota bacterium]